MNNIVIVGGGSAGWMTAATLIKVFPNKNITLIESANTPIVGVGESTLGQINNWLALLGIKDEEFIKATNGSYKLSIRFQDFYKKDSGGFHYPFGTPDLRGTQIGLNDWMFKKILQPDLPIQDYADTFFNTMEMVNQNRFSDDPKGFLIDYRPQQDVAYHFDAVKFGQFLKSNYCLNKGVKYIVGDVTDTVVTKEGIRELIINESQSIKADLFIDCTGFKSLLLDKALKEPFESYEDILPNNSAVATQIPYRNKRKELVPYTNCIAYDNGWIWQIPLWSRIGSGYVYSDKYISDEQAIVDFKDWLNKNKYPIKDCKFKTIKMRVGIHKRTFVKNVCAIGLSAGFIEPLESNGLFTVHEFLLRLIRVLKRGQVNRFDRDGYNFATKQMFRNFAEFVAMHYSLSHRTDTQYWKDIQEREYCNNLINVVPTLNNGFVKAMSDYYNNYQHSVTGGFHCIAMGMNFYPTDFDSIGSATLHTTKNHFKPGWSVAIKNLNEKVKHRRKVISKFPKFYDYLEKKFYG